MFLLSLDRRRYGDLILSLKNDCAKQQMNYLRKLIYSYRLMGAFEPTRETSMAGGAQRRPEFRKRGRQLQRHRRQESWRWLRHREKTGVLVLWRGAPEKELPKASRRRKKKDDGSAKNRRAGGKTEVKGVQLHTMFTSLVDVQSGIEFSELGEDNKFT